MTTRIAIAALVAIAACAGVLGLTRTGPQPFPHRKHVLAGVACTKCHADMARGGDTLHIPDDATCATCHAQPHDTRPCLGCHATPRARSPSSPRRAITSCSITRTHAAPTQGQLHALPRRRRRGRRPAAPADGDLLQVPRPRRRARRAQLRRLPQATSTTRARCRRPTSRTTATGCASTARAPRRRPRCARAATRSRSARSATARPSRRCRRPRTFADPFAPSVHRAGFAARHALEARARAGRVHDLPPAVELRELPPRQGRRRRRSPQPAPAGLGRHHVRRERARPRGAPRSDRVRRAATTAPAALCVGCHKVGGVGGNPHPAGWSSRLPASAMPCRLCHPIGSRP